MGLREKLQVDDDTQPLWMPRGSVRAILAVGTTAAAIATVFVGAVQSEALFALAGAVNVYYFKYREDQ